MSKIRVYELAKELNVSSKDLITLLMDEVNVEVKLVSIDKRILSFEIKAYDSRGLIGEGTHKRCVVNVEKFLSKVNG